MSRYKTAMVFLAGMIALASCLLAPAPPPPAPTHAGFTYTPTGSTLTPTATRTNLPTLASTPTQPPTPTPTPTPTRPVFSEMVPNFSHVVIFIFENKEFGSVIGNPNMPFYNSLAEEYTLLTGYYAVQHPSLPNYIALVGGDTFGIRSNCEDCYIDAVSLPDLIENSGRTWRAYLEDLPEPCFIGSRSPYAQKHNPFIYFDSIREDTGRCQRSIVPLENLDMDLDQGALPDFAMVVPNLCNSAHDCTLKGADEWLETWMKEITESFGDDPDTLVVITWDEGQGNQGCCGLATPAGGRVATLLVSPLVNKGFQDDTPYSHYSLLKTIAEGWGLDQIGHAAEPTTPLIVAPWKN